MTGNGYRLTNTASILFPIRKPGFETNHDDGFATWFRSQFFCPYASLFEYMGTDGKKATFVGPHEVEKAKVIRLNVPNGMQMYYVPATRTLFGYYHQTKMQVQSDQLPLPQERLPASVEDWFKENQVVQIDLSQGPDTTPQRISFDQFAREIHKAFEVPEGTRAMRLLSANSYVADQASLPVVPGPMERPSSSTSLAA